MVSILKFIFNWNAVYAASFSRLTLFFVCDPLHSYLYQNQPPWGLIPHKQMNKFQNNYEIIQIKMHFRSLELVMGSCNTRFTPQKNQWNCKVHDGFYILKKTLINKHGQLVTRWLWKKGWNIMKKVNSERVVCKLVPDC